MFLESVKKLIGLEPKLRMVAALMVAIVWCTAFAVNEWYDDGTIKSGLNFDREPTIKHPAPNGWIGVTTVSIGVAAAVVGVVCAYYERAWILEIMYPILASTTLALVLYAMKETVVFNGFVGVRTTLDNETVGVSFILATFAMVSNCVFNSYVGVTEVIGSRK